jgi:hypothetical protein
MGQHGAAKCDVKIFSLTHADSKAPHPEFHGPPNLQLRLDALGGYVLGAEDSKQIRDDPMY